MLISNSHEKVARSLPSWKWFLALLFRSCKLPIFVPIGRQHFCQYMYISLPRHFYTLVYLNICWYLQVQIMVPTGKYWKWGKKTAEYIVYKTISSSRVGIDPWEWLLSPTCRRGASFKGPRQWFASEKKVVDALIPLGASVWGAA